VAFKIRQNPFSARAVPRTPLGSSRRSPRPSSRLERGHPSEYPIPLGTDAFSALAMRPPEFQVHLRLRVERQTCDREVADIWAPAGFFPALGKLRGLGRKVPQRVQRWSPDESLEAPPEADEKKLKNNA